MTDMTPPGAGGAQLYLQALQDIARALGGIYNPLNTLLTSSPWTVPFGGTGRTTLTAHSVLLGEGASALNFATVGTAGRLLIDQGASADPAFTAMSTDATIAANGALTIANDAITTIKILNAAVTLAKMANLAANSVIGNNTGAGATPIALTQTQLTAMINNFTSSLSGAAPSSGGGTTNFLRADGTWAAPSGGAATLVPAADIRTGTATITIPTGATKLKVTLIGGGGGGGGAASTGGSAAAVGGPGGSAGVVVKYLSGLTPGNTLALTIGAAGTGGTAGNNAGGNGGDTTLASGSQTITTLTAAKGNGGGGAAASGTGTIGTSGAGTNGDLNITGGLSTTFNAVFVISCVTFSIVRSAAAASGLGLGTSVELNASGTGLAGRGFGGAGTGGIDVGGSTNRAGGAGTAGAAIFEWYA